MEIGERSAVTGQYTYLVEPSVAMSRDLSYKAENQVEKGIIKEIEDAERVLSRSGIR